MLKNILTIVLAATAVVNGSFIHPRSNKTSTTAIASIKSASVSATVRFAVSKKRPKGLDVTIHAKGLKRRGSYYYHIHDKPVPANGDCSATGNHWDPFKVKVADKPYKCDRKNAEKTCELGDLTGRHSKITGNRKGRHTARYHDSLISFNGTNSIIGHSIVIHGSDNKPLACANITLIEKNAKKPKDPKARKDGEASSVYSSIAYGAESKKSAAPASAVASISGFAALVAAAIVF